MSGNTAGRPGPAAGGLPEPAAEASREAAGILFRALDPAMTASEPSPEVTALWLTAKLLSALGGTMDFNSYPEAKRSRAQWHEAAQNAADIADTALSVVAAGMSPGQAADWIAEDAIEPFTPVAGTGTLDVIPYDYDQTMRTLTVVINGDGTLAVTADRGPAPEPRPQTASARIRTSHHLNRLAAVLGESVIELPEDGLPLCGFGGREVTCEVCETVADGDIARVVDEGPPSYRRVRVCSIPCARAASAGEHRE